MKQDRSFSYLIPMPKPPHENDIQEHFTSSMLLGNVMRGKQERNRTNAHFAEKEVGECYGEHVAAVCSYGVHRTEEKLEVEASLQFVYDHKRQSLLTLGTSSKSVVIVYHPRLLPCYARRLLLLWLADQDTRSVQSSQIGEWYPTLECFPQSLMWRAWHVHLSSMRLRDAASYNSNHRQHNYPGEA